MSATSNEVQELIEKAVEEAGDSGVAVILEYIDKSVIYDAHGDMSERRDIVVRVKADPP